ncbi:MAG: hypothetical protein JO190_08875 [Candidatus Eremiobacteraeota bacterium]|nr:hypothetical protein [Candidatus Eremiobacteraeota bacterium]MBV8498625.1 hypothetical protein [Candidatus Eremiobacteraeota bacterium]
MTHLHAQMAVKCPLTETEARLGAYFESLRSEDGVARMRLRVPMTGSSSALGLSLDREVRVEAARGRDEENLNDVTRIRWSPEGKAIFPKFEGKLVVWAGDDSASSRIEIDGDYLPPFGAAGQVFDEAIGHRIAESTAREFLKDIKRAIEMPFPR